MALAIHLMYLTPMSINVGKDAAVAKQLIKIQILGVDSILNKKMIGKAL
ncbi:hypothetical protein [Caldicellulosiruptor bescii]|nr:hypothetical protein [Caldicellulosiruptor bescii]